MLSVWSGQTLLYYKQASPPLRQEKAINYRKNPITLPVVRRSTNLLNFNSHCTAFEEIFVSLRKICRRAQLKPATACLPWLACVGDFGYKVMVKVFRKFFLRVKTKIDSKEIAIKDLALVSQPTVPLFFPKLNEERGPVGWFRYFLDSPSTFSWVNHSRGSVANLFWAHPTRKWNTALRYNVPLLIDEVKIHNEAVSYSHWCACWYAWAICFQSSSTSHDLTLKNFTSKECDTYSFLFSILKPVRGVGFFLWM